MRKIIIKYAIITIIAVLFCTAIIVILDNIHININNTNTNRYETLDELVSKSPINLDLPGFVNTYDDLTFEIIAGQIVQIYNNDFVLKVTPYIDINADPLGIYSKSECDNAYTVNNSDINYMRYRTGNTEFPNSTIINWVLNGSSYGLMVNWHMEFDEVLKLLGITETDIKLIDRTKVVSNNTIDNKYKTIQYKISDNVTIALPAFRSQYTVDTENNIHIFSFDNKIVFAIMQSHGTDGILDGDGVAQIGNGLCIKYRSTNPFERGTTEYEDYNNLLDMIKNNKIVQN